MAKRQARRIAVDVVVLDEGNLLIRLSHLAIAGIPVAAVIGARRQNAGFCLEEAELAAGCGTKIGLLSFYLGDGECSVPSLSEKITKAERRIEQLKLHGNSRWSRLAGGIITSRDPALATLGQSPGRVNPYQLQSAGPQS